MIQNLAMGRTLGTEPAEESLILLSGFMEHAHIQGSRQEVVGCGDGMDVACHVQVELLHGHHLKATKGVKNTGDQFLAVPGVVEAR